MPWAGFVKPLYIMIPSIGRVVIYNTTEEEQQKMRDMESCNVQEKLPAAVVAVWGDTEESAINLNVQLDGEGSFWVTSALKGDEAGQWNWPVIKK